MYIHNTYLLESTPRPPCSFLCSWQTMKKEGREVLVGGRSKAGGCSGVGFKHQGLLGSRAVATPSCPAKILMECVAGSLNLRECVCEAQVTRLGLGT